MKATVTDANLVLGRIQTDGSISGGVKLDLELARTAIQLLSQQLALSVEDTALGIVEIANEHMARALRLVSTNRGYDVQQFSIASFGGAGGLHVCALADAMNITAAVVPLNGGVLSAFGMLVAARGRQLSRTFRVLLDEAIDNEILAILDDLAQSARRQLIEEGVAQNQIVVFHAADICYLGQSATLTIPWSGKVASADHFHAEHQKRYGYSLPAVMEIVNLRVNLVCTQTPPPIPQYEVRNDLQQVLFTTRIHGHAEKVNVYQRIALAVGEKFSGPAIVVEPSATTFIQSQWNAQIDEHGNILLSKSVAGKIN